MKKRTTNLLAAAMLAILLLLSLSGCGNSTDHAFGGNIKSGQTADALKNGGSAAGKTNQNEKSSEKTEVFNQTATLEETIMFDENNVKITATGLSYNNYSFELDLLIENNSDTDLSIISGSVGYSCNSINGLMRGGGYLNCSVASGKKATDSIRFDYDNLMMYGINEIADIEIGFMISDDNHNQIYSGPRQVKTSAFETYDYSQNRYQKAIIGSSVLRTNGYDVPYFSEECLYDENGVRLLSSSMLTNSKGGALILLEFENSTDQTVNISTSDVVLNGLYTGNSYGDYNTINPGKKCISELYFDAMEDSEIRKAFGIDRIGTVEFSVKQVDSENTGNSEAVPVSISVTNEEAAFDRTGAELYNSGGIRIISKGLMEDLSEYRDDLHVFLLIENNSGRAVWIDDVYDSLSVNGFMTDYSCYSKSVEDGQSAAFEIELWRMYLDRNNITSISDVKDLEMKLEIKDGWTVLDEVNIQMQFE